MPLKSAIDGRPGDREDLGKVADAVLARVVHPPQLSGLSVGELGLLASELSLRAGDGHPLPGAHSDQVALEFRERGPDVEEHLPHRVGRIIDGGAQGQLDIASQELVGDCTCVGDRSGQPVKLRHDERVAGAHRCKGLVETGACASAPGQAVIGVDALRVHSEPDPGRALRREVLPVGGAAGVSDADSLNGGEAGAARKCMSI